MSLIGIDVGSSATKAAAYREDGLLLAVAREEVTARHPHPGEWESDPEEVWSATQKVLSNVAAAPPVRKDPPVALAISASGREVFPVASDASALGPCIRTGDTRGAEIAAATSRRATTDEWLRVCGHMPDRMDPVNRLLWWRKNRPEAMSRAKYFLGWHEFLTLRLGGRAVTDKSLASKWLAYDLATGRWSSERLAEFGVDAGLLPEIEPWGAQVAALGPSLATELGLPKDLAICVGGFDTCCAGLGSGASNVGIAGLACGSWESVLAPALKKPSARDLSESGLSVGPHPGSTGLAAFALSPNGTIVVDWARGVTNLSIPSFENRLCSSGPEPSPVLAVPHLSGVTSLRADAQESQGALFGLTLASSQIDITKAFMESIACDLALTLSSFERVGIDIELLRASGGGARSGWWMQLKADLCDLPIEVVGQPEPEAGTLGAALLAGISLGTYVSVEEAVRILIRTTRRYEPNVERASLYEQRFEAYKAAAKTLLLNQCE